MTVEAPEVAAKECRGCGERKALEDFGRDRRNRDGRQGRCRDCQRVTNARRTPEQHRRSNARRDPALQRERARAYYARNLERG